MHNGCDTRGNRDTRGIRGRGCPQQPAPGGNQSESLSLRVDEASATGKMEEPPVDGDGLVDGDGSVDGDSSVGGDSFSCCGRRFIGI